MEYVTHDSRICCIDGNGNEVGTILFPKREGNVYEITSTKVDPSMQGKGIAAGLMRHCLNEISRRRGTVQATCSYAQNYLAKHGLRPLVICHMVTSIDGRVTGKFLSGSAGVQASEAYYDYHRAMQGDAFACGRVTMESSFTGGFKPDLSEFAGADLPHEDYIARKHGYYAVSFDRHGSVGWQDGILHDEDPGYDDCHIIEVLSEDTPAEMLAYYRKIGVSYLFAGREDIEIKTALQKLYALFGIRVLLLEGGSIINGAFLRAGCVDKISQVIAPVIADQNDKPLFSDAGMTEFRMTSCETTEQGAVRIWYEA
ncbi:MAG: GNAT family N-acetyltransferase [Oscillospiraceae bacterium]|nr:GNAT family N-acetyltransferase [Oscillospiraceae bacterium]